MRDRREASKIETTIRNFSIYEYEPHARRNNSPRRSVRSAKSWHTHYTVGRATIRDTVRDAVSRIRSVPRALFHPKYEYIRTDNETGGYNTAVRREDAVPRKCFLIPEKKRRIEHIPDE